MSQRRSCAALGVARSSCQYRPRRSRDDGLIVKLRELAVHRPRYGYRRLHVLLRRDGFVVNHKRVWRVYVQQGLAVRRRERRRLAAGARVILDHPTRPNQIWAMDFMGDSLAVG